MVSKQCSQGMPREKKMESGIEALEGRVGEIGEELKKLQEIEKSLVAVL